MKGFKDKGFAERRQASAKAKQDNLKDSSRSRRRTIPAEIAKREARIALAEARKARPPSARRKGGRRQRAIAAEEAGCRRAARGGTGCGAEAELERKQKADRDARYAAAQGAQALIDAFRGGPIHGGKARKRPARRPAGLAPPQAVLVITSENAGQLKTYTDIPYAQHRGKIPAAGSKN